MVAPSMFTKGLIALIQGHANIEDFSILNESEIELKMRFSFRKNPPYQADNVLIKGSASVPASRNS